MTEHDPETKVQDAEENEPPAVAADQEIVPAGVVLLLAGLLVSATVAVHSVPGPLSTIDVGEQATDVLVDFSDGAGGAALAGEKGTTTPNVESASATTATRATILVGTPDGIETC